MAFRFTWPIFSADFLDRATLQLESALNGGTKPAQIVGRISVKELHLGTQPPDLEMLEIGELLEDKFRGMFKLTYSGDAYLVLQMSVQVGLL
jgi:distribution and morphology protein 34